MKIMKRSIAWLLVACMMIGWFPVTAAATAAPPESVDAPKREIESETAPSDAVGAERTESISLNEESPFQITSDFQPLEIRQTGPLEAEITVSARAEDTSNLVVPETHVVFSYTSWEELVTQYVQYGINGFAELSYEHCMEVMAEEVYNQQVIWTGFLEEENIEILGCTYSITESDITASHIDLAIEKVYQIYRDGHPQTLSATSRLQLTYSEDNRWYIQSDTLLTSDAEAFGFEESRQDYIINSYSTGYPNTWTNTGDQAVDIAQIALTQVGYTETNNHTKYNAWFYGSDTGAAWCAIFISWCANQAGISTSVVKKNAIASGYNLSNMNSNSYGAPAYAFGAKTPKAGDIAYINNDSDGYSDHVGLVYAVDSNYIYTVEGNYSNKVSTVKYSRSSGVHSSNSGTSILFLARPNYAKSQPEENFSYTLHVWISDTKMGSVPGVYRMDHSYYLCYEIYDSDTGVALNTSHPGLSYNVTEKVLRPDGSTLYEGVHNRVDGGWMRCTMDTTGTHSGIVTLSGDLDLSLTVSWTVQHELVVGLRTWISDSGLGDAVDVALQGEYCYFCYTLTDRDSGTPVNELPGTIDYTFTFSVYNPDGSLVHSYTSSDDSGWIGFLPKYAGEYKVVSQLEGSISGGTYTGTREHYKTITENPPQITSSAGSVNLTLGGTESATINLTKTGYYNGSWNFSVSKSNSNVSTSWGDWDGSTCPLTITAQSEGTTTLTIRLKDYDTDATLDTCTVNVTVSSRKYTVSYNANGGSGAPASQIKSHGTNLTLSSTVPTRFGYNFLGWSTSSTATSPSYYSGGSYSANSSTTLYAVWGTPNEISGNYAGFTRAATINNGGAGVYFKFTPYTSTYYRIYGIDDKDTRVYLYDAGGNELGSNDDGGEGNQFQLDYNFTAGTTYYIYVRYYSSSQTGTLDYKIAYGYRIRYDANGGSGAPPTTYKYYDFDGTLSTTAPTKSGSTFRGWARSSTATTAEYQPGDTITENASITLYAVWKQDSYTVSYNANGGTGAPDSQIKTPGTALTLSSTVPTRFGYTFLGWSTSSTATSAAYLPGGSFTTDANTTLYAVWQSAVSIASGVTDSTYSASIPFADAHKYYCITPSFTGKIRFESTGSTDTLIYLYDANGNQLASDDDSGDGRNFMLTYSVTSGTKYYIKVKHFGSATGTIFFSVKRAYTISFNANGGSGAPADQVKVYGETLTLSSETPTKSASTFLGWARSSTATTAEYQPGGTFTINANTTLYAVWAANCDNGHSYTYKVTKTPTTSATGTLTGTCSRCSGTTTVTLPKLNTTDYSHSITKAATCTTSGTGRYTWKTTTYGSFSFDVTIQKLGHDMIDGICNRCGVKDPGWGSVTKKLVKMVFTRYADMVEDYDFEYNVDGRVSKIGTATIRYDEEGRCLSSAGGYDTYTYDENGNMTYRLSLLGEGIISKTWWYYDSNGCLSKSVMETGNTAWTNIFSTYTTTYVCNARGEVIEESSEGSTTYYSYTYDDLGRITSETAEIYEGSSSTPTRVVREYDYNNYKPFVAVITRNYIQLVLCDSMGTPVWNIQDPLGTAATEINPETDRDGYVVYADEIYDFFTWEFFYEDASSSAKTVASGWSGNTQWTLTDDGVLRFYGSGNMKNYGYNGGQPWASYKNQITSIIVEKGVTAIGEGAFKDLTKLKSVTLPSSGLTKIGEAAFYGCTSLKEITIPEGIYTVWSYTFKNCTSLTSVKLPKTLIKVDQGAFENCTSLPYIYFPTDVEIIGSWSFKGCTGLKEADMTWTDATKIREGAFKNCSSLTTIHLPVNIQVLGDSCFYGIGATSFTVPDTVTSIEAWCFARAYSLTKITFQGNAPKIGQGAFNKISLTAYYPRNNSTWNADVRLNYGGTVIWKAQ